MQSLLSKLKKMFCGSKNQDTTTEQSNTTVNQTQPVQTPVIRPTETRPSISSEEKQVRIALEDIDLQHPEQSRKLKEVTPFLHKYPLALSFMSRYYKVGAYYLKTLHDQYGNTVPFEIEKALIESRYINLLFEFSSQGLKWSNSAKELLKQHHKSVYCQLFGYK